MRLPMSCVLSKDALSPIYTQGLSISRLITNPQENGQLLGKENIEKELFSTIGLVLTLPDKGDVENNPFIDKFKALNDLIKTSVSDPFIFSKILDLLNKIKR